MTEESQNIIINDKDITKNPEDDVDDEDNTEISEYDEDDEDSTEIPEDDDGDDDDYFEASEKKYFDLTVFENFDLTVFENFDLNEIPEDRNDENYDIEAGHWRYMGFLAAVVRHFRKNNINVPKYYCLKVVGYLWERYKKMHGI
jgi:hypothetical protein